MVDNKVKSRSYIQRQIIDIYIKYLSKLEPPIIGVEIGVWKGENAKNILSIECISKLYMIDPYLAYKDYTSKERSVYKICNQQQYDEVYNDIYSTFTKAYGNRIEFLRYMSNDAVNKIPDNLAFVYIDGNHTKEYLQTDLKLYYPKIRKGGIISGHDYGSSFYHEVKPVVNAFCYNNRLRLRMTETEDWWCTKNE